MFGNIFRKTIDKTEHLCYNDFTINKEHAFASWRTQKMTAAINQTLTVYNVNFEGCCTKLGFLMRLARAFRLDTARVVKGQAWQAFRESIAALCADGAPVCVRISGLDDAYTELPVECDALLNLLRGASQRTDSFRAEAYVGKMKWNV